MATSTPPRCGEHSTPPRCGEYSTLPPRCCARRSSAVAFSGHGVSVAHDASGVENAFKSFLAGGFSGALAKSVIAPLDRLKIIFQISHMEFHFKAVWRELARTVAQEGPRALFRGNLAQVLRVYPYSGVQLMTFDRYADLLTRHRRRRNAAAGGGEHGGGAPSQAIVVPLSMRAVAPGPVPGAGAAGSPPGAPHPHHYRSTSQKERLTGAEKMLAGAAAGATSVIATYPLDLMRARLAVQMEAPPPEALPPHLREAMLQCQHQQQPLPTSSASAAASTVAGASSSASGSGPGRPAAAAAGAGQQHHHLRIPQVRSYSGMLHAFGEMYREQGIRSFYRGMAPTLLGILPYAGLAFFTFESCKQAYADLHGGTEPGSLHKLAFGGLAGLVGQCCTYPLDIVRRRMQTEGFSAIHAHHVSAHEEAAAAAAGSGTPGGGAGGSAAAAGRHSSVQSALWRVHAMLPAPLAARMLPQPGGMMDTAGRILRREGVRGLFKGLSLNFIKGPVAVGVSFTTFDLLKRSFDIE